MSFDLNKLKSESNKSTTVGKSSDFNLMEFLNRDFKFKKGLRDKKKERFYSELSILLVSGIDIKTALEIAVNSSENKVEKEFIEKIKNQIISGGSLSESIRFTNLFSNYEYFSLKIGEESGRVNSVLADLAKYYARKIEQKRKIINTFSYPVIVFFVAVSAVVFMLNFIVPMFSDVFTRFGGELPWLTKMILRLSDGISAYGLYVVLILISCLIPLIVFKNHMLMRKFVSGLLLKIPFVNTLISKIYLARFSHSMQLLMVSRNPLLNSIQLVRKMVGFYPLEIALAAIEKDILNGESLHHSMLKYPIFNKKMVALVQVGEEVNQLDTIFKQLDEQYTKDIEYQTDVIGNLMEPILIVFIGGFVAVILIAMYLPLFQLSTSIF